MNVELRPCTLLRWALCDGDCEKCRTFATTETVYNRYIDTAGNYHWKGVYSGEHIVRMGSGEKKARLIDADKLFGVIAEQEMWNVPDFVYESIQNAPTVDAEPVRHGHWLFYEEPDGYYHTECSECGQWCDEDVFLKGKWHYCPCCGAKMDEVENAKD